MHEHHHEHSEEMLGFTFSYVVMESDELDSDGPIYGIHYSKPSGKKLFNHTYDYALGLHYMNNEHPHIALMAGVMFDLSETTQLGIMPTYSFLKHDHSSHDGDMPMNMNMDQNDWETELGIHIELMFKTSILNQELNPLINYCYSKDHTHYSIGLHFHL
tara:strand:- start:2423 stop:2899 length:477 start_codon:yes stop_codon:yes gene_type:complete